MLTALIMLIFSGQRAEAFEIATFFLIMATVSATFQPFNRR